MAFSVHEVVRVACVSCTGVDSTTLQTSHNNDFVNAKSHAREKWGGETWWGPCQIYTGKTKKKTQKEKQQQQKKQGRLNFCPALLFECLELTNIQIAITRNGGGQKVKIDEVLSSCFYSDYKQGRHASIPEVPKMLKNSVCALWFEYVKKKQQQTNKKS